MKTEDMINELRAMQRQFIHGPDLFGKIANRLEALDSFCREIETDTDDRVSPGFKNKARLIGLLR